jgi:ABC-type uncharacterized transport system ATPase subunit
MTSHLRPALELTGIVKHFGELRALDGASLAVAPGTVHALLGENGAGKTTLMRVAFGLVRPDAGVVRIAGESVRLASPADAIERGVGMVHQHFTLVPAMTVAENVALGGRGRYRLREARERVLAIGRETGLALDPDAPVASLAVSAQQRLEIVKALARDACTLILDEPTAVLAPAEVAELLAMLRRLAAAGGSVVLITHKLREALAAADAVTVLRRGRTVATMPAAAATPQSLADAMLGEGAEVGFGARSGALGAAGGWAPGAVPGERSAPAERGAPPNNNVSPAPVSSITNPFSPASRPPADAAPSPLPPAGAPRRPIISARAVDVRDERGVARVRGATFEVHAGEIVGVVGVEGAGQRELLRALAGRLAPSAGALDTPSRVGFIPEDRHRDALVLDFALHENVALKGAGTARGLMRWPAVLARTAELLRRHDVRAPGPRAPARELSGGNQQKLVLARELDDSPDAVIAENPTRGLDIAATTAVHERLRAARDAGAAVVVYSSDLDEVLTLADRVLVVFAGLVRADVPREREAVGRAMLGLA